MGNFFDCVKASRLPISDIESQHRRKFYLAVPTSRFGMVLLPIAYVAFFLLMNSRKLLGDSMPTGYSRFLWNFLMAIGVVLAMIGSAISIMNDNTQIPGTTILVRHLAMSLAGGLLIIGIVIHLLRSKKVNRKADSQ